MPAIKRLLVPTDFSTTSDLAFHYAMDMAKQQGSSMHLLHIIDDGTLATAYPDGFYVDVAGLRARLTEQAAERLEKMAARCTAQGIQTTTEVAVGRPARVITDTATVRGTDLIVMGTHGRSGFAHLILGSVAERVLRTAPCAVLIVRDTARIADALAAQTRDQEATAQT